MTLQTDGPHFRIGSDADLGDLWATLMGPGGFGHRTLWLLFLDDERWTLPVIMPNEDLGARPAERDLDALAHLLDLVRRDHLAESFAALLSRPGSHHKTDDDRDWAVAVARVAREQSFPMWPVHLAAYERVQPMGADDLIGA